VTDKATDALPKVDGYSDEHRPLAGYSVLTSVFGAALAAALIAARRSGREFPERYGVWDVITVGIATHKLSRLLAKDKVTSFIRAPFVRYEQSSGQGEVSEEPRGRGLRLAIGELLACPYCLGQWVAAGLAVSMVAAPRLTRLLTFIYSAETIGDFLQLGYLAAEERAST
jgi:Protein of unknown function (DUF1360)